MFFSSSTTLVIFVQLSSIYSITDKIHNVQVEIMHLLVITQQTQVGEMEVWTLVGLGAACILQEMLTYKFDHIRARQEIFGTTIIKGTIPKPEKDLECFRLVV